MLETGPHRDYGRSKHAYCTVRESLPRPRPIDPRQIFNRLNARGRFEDMEILDTYPFQPNQAVMFVKTFNSWHSVRPMTGMGSKAMRKTLTINIEAR